MYELINDVQIKVKEYNEQRVVTFKDIDTVHNRPAGTAGRNFRVNREHFIEGEDFFTLELTNDEIRRQFGAGKNAGKTMTLITENGYLMLVKSFTDDLAWSVQRQLVKTYFRAMHTETLYNEAILKILENQEEIKKELNKLKTSVNRLETSVDRLEKRQNNLRQYVKKEFVHIRKDISEIFDNSLGKNNQTMIPALVFISDDVKRTIRNLISYYFER